MYYIMSDISDNVDPSITPYIEPEIQINDLLYPFYTTDGSYTVDISLGHHRFRDFAVIYISTSNEELRNKYIEVANEYNVTVSQNLCPDSGFDLYVPDDVSFNTHYDTTFIDMQVNAKMIYHLGPMTHNSGFNMYPRSSVSKTPLMLANHVGVIDCGYRGSLIGAFRWLPVNDNQSYTVAKYTRLVQVCHPTLCPLFVMVVKDIPEDTVRGSNGFGSTGI